MTPVAAQEQPEPASPPDDRPTIGISPAKFRLAFNGPVYRVIEFAFSDGSRVPVGLTELQWAEIAAAFGAVCEICGRPTDTPPECGPCWFVNDMAPRSNR